MLAYNGDMTAKPISSSPIRWLGASLAVLLPLGIIAGCSDDTTTGQTSAQSSSTQREDTTVKRTTINPWQWSVEMGFNQGELVEGGSEVLYLAGQSSMSADGAPQHAGDMASQVTLALDNLEAVLTEADMDLSNIVRLNTYTTDIDAMFANYGIVAERLGAAGVQPPGSLLGVSRLAFPELMVEFEAIAVR